MIERVAGDAQRGKHLLAGFFPFAVFFCFVLPPGKTTADGSHQNY
jgi:hypothetical protein